MEAFDILNKAGCEMKLICKKKWIDLLETEIDGIRFCTDCKKSVFYTTTSAELRVAAERNLCVYIPPSNLASMAKARKYARQSDLVRDRIKQLEVKTLRRLKGPNLGVVIVK